MKITVIFHLFISESGSFYINNSNLKRLATIAMVLTNNPHLRLEVIGNTDKNGDLIITKNLPKTSLIL